MGERVGRHRTPEEKRELGEKARAMRADGRSRREIREVLRIGDDLAKAFLRDTEVPDALRRPRAKDAQRELAVVMRLAGRTYDEIAAELGVSKSTCSLWLRDLPRPVADTPPQPEAMPPAVGASASPPDVLARRDRARALRARGLLLSEIAAELGVSVKTVYYYTLGIPVPERGLPRGRDPEALRADVVAYWEREGARRRAERERDEREHARAVGPLTRTQLHIAAVTAYWCEGTKSKSYAVREQVTFINSDVGLIRLWLAYLDDVGFPEENRKLSIAIHESADVASAERSWARDLGIPVERLGRPTLKRHNPKTVRRNTGDEYRGCLIVRLTQCAALYRRISGTWTGIMGALPASGPVPNQG
jgi:transposase